MTAATLPAVRTRQMNLWRLEWLRLTRTPRAIALAAVFLFIGFVEPVVTRYEQDLIGALSSVLGTSLRIKALSAAQLAATPGAPRSGHGGPDELSARTPAVVQPPEPPHDTAPPRTLSAEAQLDSAPVAPPSADLTGMDLIKRELGGRIIAEIDET